MVQLHSGMQRSGVVPAKDLAAAILLRWCLAGVESARVLCIDVSAVQQQQLDYLSLFRVWNDGDVQRRQVLPATNEPKHALWSLSLTRCAR
jgi:hypothetical protein